jgi:outer membrane protein
MKKLVLLLLLSSIAQVMVAQEEQSGGTLSFKDAVKTGLQNNVILNQQKNQLVFTQINKTSSLLQMGPSIQANGNVYRNDGNNFNQQEGRVVNGVIDYVGGQLNASMPIFSGFSVLNQYRQANNTNEAQLHQVVRSNQDVIRDVANQYLQCLLDQELIMINEENVATQQVQYDQIREQVSLGSIPEADLYNQEYQWKNAELLLVRARTVHKNDMTTLALTIQADPRGFTRVENVDWDINKLVADSISFDEMISTAMDRRSDLKQAGHAEKAAHYGYSSLKGRYYPSIYAGANYGSRFNYIHGEDNRSFSDQFTKDNLALSYGVSISIPIYSGLQSRSQAAFAKVNYKNAQILAQNTEVTVQSDVIRAYQNFRDAKTNYVASQAQLQAAEISYRMERERYDLGISNIVQLTLVNQTFVRAQGDYKSSLYALMFQRLLMNYAMGTLKFEDIP